MTGHEADKTQRNDTQKIKQKIKWRIENLSYERVKISDIKLTCLVGETVATGDPGVNGAGEGGADAAEDS